MAEHANIGSIEALESFRSALLIFLKKSTGCVDEAASEIRRTRMWIENDSRLHWEREIRKRRNALDRAEQELMSARLSALRENLSGQQMAVRRAREEVDEAETKLRNIKRWVRDYEASVGPLYKQLESLRNLLEDQVPKAAAFLYQAQRTLEDYAGVTAPPTSVGSSAPQSESEEPK